MNKTKLTKLTMILVIFISLIGFVSALGVGPTKKSIDFVPGMEHEITLKILNNEHKDLSVVVYARGEMAEYLSSSANLLKIRADEDYKEFTYTVKLPEKLEKPGVHEADIVIIGIESAKKEIGVVGLISEVAGLDSYNEKEKMIATIEDVEKLLESGGGGVGVGAVPAVVSKLKVRVPYPGKYAESKVYVTSSTIGGDVLFTVPVFNFGGEDITIAKAKIDVYGATYEKIGETSTNEISIPSKGEGKVVSIWKADVNAGVYRAIIKLDYDDKQIELQKSFEVGNLHVGIKKVDVDDFKLGDVAKFDIYVENMWNQLLKDVYGEVIVTGKDGTEHTRFKTASIDLDSYGTGKLEAYWSTKGVPIGAYDLDLTIFYEGKTTNKLIEANVNIDSITTEGVVGRVIGAKGVVNRDTVLMFVLFILVVVNIGWFIYIKRRTVKN